MKVGARKLKTCLTNTRSRMAYKNVYGESLYMFGWLTAEPGSKDFKRTTGGNTVWAKSKRQAISKVNKERKEVEKKNPDKWQLRVDPSTCCRAKTSEEHMSFDRGLYFMTI